MATDNEGESEEQLDPWVPLIEEQSDVVILFQKMRRKF